jgi:adenylate cyclase
LPEEKKAIERRGTDSVEAHDLYLMARQTYITGQEVDVHSAEAVVRLCARATEIDSNYAQAWALMAAGYYRLQYAKKGRPDDGIAAVEHALALDPNLAEAHGIKAQILLQLSDASAASKEVAIALDLGPESYEANRSAGRLNYQLRQFKDAIRFLEKAAALMETDVNSPFLLTACYNAAGDPAGARRAAEWTLKRVDAVLVHEPNNVAVIAYSVYALALLGESERAKARMNRALLIAPIDFNMRYNFACTLSSLLKDRDAALDMLEAVFATITETFLAYAKADSDFDSLRDNPRYQAMVAAAEARLAAPPQSAAPTSVAGS